MLPADLQAIQSAHGDDKTMERMSAGSFLPRIMILQGLSRMCAGRDAKAKPGDIVLVRGKDSLIRNYGDLMPMFVIQRRAKALIFDPAGKGRSFFDPTKKEFSDIEAKASMKPRPKGYLFGPEYLVYVPDVDQLATFFFSTPTMRNRATEMSAQRGLPTIVKSVFIESGGNQWYGPEPEYANSPIGLPEGEAWDALMVRIKPTLESFANPPKEGIAEEVDESGAAPADARPQ